MDGGAAQVDGFGRLVVAFAGLLGAVGMVAAAGASHAGDAAILNSLALVALTQAPALLALGLLGGKGRLLRLATAVIGLGALIFCADLAMRHFTGNRLFPMAAPIGGSALIAGWALLIPAGLLRRG